MPQRELRRLVASGLLPSVRNGLGRQIRNTDLDNLAAGPGSAKSGSGGKGADDSPQAASLDLGLPSCLDSPVDWEALK
jgi:hypothetical protein